MAKAFCASHPIPANVWKRIFIAAIETQTILISNCRSVPFRGNRTVVTSGGATFLYRAFDATNQCGRAVLLLRFGYKNLNNQPVNVCSEEFEQ